MNSVKKSVFLSLLFAGWVLSVAGSAARPGRAPPGDDRA